MPSASHENLSPNGLEGNSKPGRCPPMSTDSLLPGSAKTELQHRLDICIAGRWMYEQGYNVACEGNVSVRLDDKRILTTPTCMNKGMLAWSECACRPGAPTHFLHKLRCSPA